jgi:hypothetical protein
MADTAPTPTGFAEIVGDDFPVLHWLSCFTDCSEPFVVHVDLVRVGRSPSGFARPAL